jgi:hypothetical protein
MPQEPQGWGGEVRFAEWLRRLLRRPPRTDADTPERMHESRQPKASDIDALEHMRAAGTLAPHHSELPSPDRKRAEGR